MTTTQTTPTQSGFQPIPTRIKDVPPLIIDKTEEQIRTEVTARLAELAIRLADTHRATAEAYLSQAMYAEALKHLEAAATFSPANLEYHNQLGFVRYIEGDDEGAIQSFTTVLEVQSNNADALFNLGMVLFGKSETAKAEDCFRRSLEIRPDDAETWNNRGVCLFQQGRAEEAKACFNRTLELEPGNEDARANLTAFVT